MPDHNPILCTKTYLKIVWVLRAVKDPQQNFQETDTPLISFVEILKGSSDDGLLEIFLHSQK